MDTQTFWQAAEQGRLLIQQCENCGGRQFYPRVHCKYCHSESVTWIEASGEAEIYSYSVVRRAPSVEFADQVPYVVALVELTEGPHLLVQLEECEPENVKIGMSFRIGGHGNAATHQLPRFVPNPGTLSV